jgi:uncharacterized membrane protein
MKQRGKGFTGFAAWVGFAAAASGCGGWVDLQSSGGGAGSAGHPGGAAGVSGGTSAGGSEAVGGTSSINVSAGTSSVIGQGGAGGGPLEVLAPPEPTLIPPGAEGPGITWTGSVKVYAGRLADGVLAGTTAYCFKKPLSGDSCSWLSDEPFIWLEDDGMVPLDVQGLGGINYFPSRVSLDGTTVVGSFRKANGEFGLFRWTQESGAQHLGEPAGSPGYEYLSDDGKIVAGMFKSNDARGHLNFLWNEEDGFQPLTEASGWPANSEVRGLSADGAVILGATTGVQPGQVFRFSAGSAEQLGSLAGFPSCDVGYLTSLSRDGEAVFGACTSQDQQTSRAFRWTEATGLVALRNASCEMNGVHAVSIGGESAFGMGTCGDVRGLVRWTSGAGVESLPAAPTGFALDNLIGTSENGSAAFGALRAVGPEPTTPPLPNEVPQFVPISQAFRWSEADGVQQLPLAAGQSYGLANAIDPSGQVVVGRAGRGDNDAKAALWDSAGLLELEAYLKSQGVTLQGIELNTAQDVAVRDGMIHVLGYVDAANFAGAWIARVPLVR